MTGDWFDVAVIGGGIGGATAAAHVAPTKSLVLLEQENELAFHTTSRSAAVFLEHDGGFAFRRLNRAARDFFVHPHEELDAPLMTPLPVLNLAPPELRDEMVADAASAEGGNAVVRFVEGTELNNWCPVLRPELELVGVLEESAGSIDVMGLHQLYVRRARAAGAEIRRSSKVTAITKLDTGWKLATASGEITAGTIVNAAGAWGDEVAELAGVEPIGLTPMRRTAFTTSISVDPTGWPLVYGGAVEQHCYFKPEAGNQLLCSLADETPSAPLDARPEEIDIALAIDHINHLTTLGIRSVATSWAGLRTFSPDREPVFGFDDQAHGWFWMVGQGGWGIVSSPAAGQVCASAINGEGFPEAIAATGLTANHLRPRRTK